MIAAIALVALSHVQTTSILDYVQTDLKDATFVAKVMRGDERELRKINDDFGVSYKFKTAQIRMKDPFMLRMEATVEDTSILYIVDGPVVVYRIPRAGIHTSTNNARHPGRRQTFLDFGLLTPSLFGNFFDAKFVRKDRATGDAVFDLTYSDKKVDDSSRHRIWIDPAKKIVTKREWYDQEGKQKATFLYQEPTEVDGVWMPTQLTVKNNDNAVAGITKYISIKINTGLTNSLFDVR